MADRQDAAPDNGAVGGAPGGAAPSRRVSQTWRAAARAPQGQVSQTCPRGARAPDRKGSPKGAV